MKVYFLLEDGKSFFKVLPEWLRHVDTSWRVVKSPEELQDGTFLIESGHGYPHLLRNLSGTLALFAHKDIQLDLVVSMFDTDGVDAAALRNEIAAFEKCFAEAPRQYRHVIVPMNVCFETWLLGNRAVYPVQCIKQFQPWAEFYDVSKDDPEQMEKPENFHGSISMYHYRYLQEMLRAAQQPNYSKGSPMFVSNEPYWRELVARATDTGDIQSFQSFLDVLYELAGKGVTAKC